MSVIPSYSVRAGLARRTCTVGADVASMTHTARLSSTNMLVEVQLVESLAIAAISGFAEQLLNVSCCFSPVISYADD